jgi:hypothetical protein
MWKMRALWAILLFLASIAGQVRLHFSLLLCVCCIYVLRDIHVPLDGSSSQTGFGGFTACQLSSDVKIFWGGCKVSRPNECGGWLR